MEQENQDSVEQIIEKTPSNDELTGNRTGVIAWGARDFMIPFTIL